MKQVTQSLRDGAIEIAEVPPPILLDAGILVRTRASLISAGTERMMMQLASKSLMGKAKERPDLVKKVFDKIRRDGLLATLRSVQDKLDREVPTGYSTCGEVCQVGARAREFSVGQRVACAGAGFANHAEVNYVPRLLAVPVPQGVSTEAAAYTTVGAIAMQGVRNAELRVGEVAVVIGLGLLGQLAVQILRGAGCRVVGLDLSQSRAELARQHGAELVLTAGGDEAAKSIMDFTRGRGADAVLITAATSSNAPVEEAALFARDRARVVMVGVTGMEIPRTPYYMKELTLVVSRSYGPGRYDAQYEEHGHDYPPGHVRWTEQRNMEAFLDLVASGAVRPEVCTTHHFPIGDAKAAFELIVKGSEPYLGVVLTYPDEPGAVPVTDVTRIAMRTPAARKPIEKVGVSVVGAGGFARAVHLPNLAKQRSAALRGVVDAAGMAARSAAKKYGFAFCASTEEEIFGDADTDAVLLITPHSRHAEGVCRVLAAGKAAFVEKPLAISLDQLRQIRQAVEAHGDRLMVGFNRRFSPLAERLKGFLDGRGPKTILYRCNAGQLPAEHWIADPSEGGRIIGEACHFFDLFAYLTGAAPKSVYAVAPTTGSADDAVITVDYADGSVGQLTYTSQGPPAYSKERIEVFAGGAAGVIEDFRRLDLHADRQRSKTQKLLQANKGHQEELAAFLDALHEGGPMPIPLESLFETTLVSFAALASIRQATRVNLADLKRELAAAPS